MFAALATPAAASSWTRLAAAVALLSISLPSAAATYLVRPDGTGDFPNLQAAIDACVDGDLVELADGVFTGAGNRDIRFHGRSIAVQSASGDPYTCVIDCENQGRGFLFVEEDGDVAILGVTIRNGVAPDRGGAIMSVAYGPITILDCVLENNAAPGNGGAVEVEGVGLMTFGSCTFAGNRGSVAGAVGTCPGRFEAYECTFFGNEAPTGSAIAICGGFGPSTLQNSIVAFNLGGAAVECSDSSPVLLSCCDVFGNSGGDWVGCLEPQEGVDGNIALDPMFCDPEGGDFALDADSPCAPFSPPNPECDQIGAWPVGCGAIPTVPTTWGRVKSRFDPARAARPAGAGSR